MRHINYGLFFIVSITSIVIALLMQASITLSLTETYDSHYYIYQTVLYGMSLLVFFKYRSAFQSQTSINLLLTFGVLCFLVSILHADVINLRSIISMFFNTLIMPVAFGCGILLGSKLSKTKNRDVYIVILQLPALFYMYVLQIYSQTNSFFSPDTAFIIIIFFPFVFFLKREWLTMMFVMIYMMFALLAAKRSILIYLAFCFVIFIIYLFFFKAKQNYRVRKYYKLFVIGIIILLIYFISSSNNEALVHFIDRTDRLGGLTESNGRTDIYMTVFKLFYSSDVFPFLFGHGNNAVLNDLEVGAHNDILEILYDYGLLATIL